MITDYSAVAFEVAILEKPLFFYLYDIEKYENARGPVSYTHLTDEEKKIIIDLSNKIVKHKNMLKVEEKDKIVGGN